VWLSQALSFLAFFLVCARIVLLLALILVLLFVYFLEPYFDLLLERCNRSLPFRFLTFLTLAPGPEMVLLLLGEELIDL
jgi:hypothetical protein